MQADTAMPTQSAPQVSPTQPISYGAPVAGGNISTGPLSVTITGVGEGRDSSLVRRAGARPGDAIWVTGTPGLARVGLEFLQDWRNPQPGGPCRPPSTLRRAVRAYKRPTARVREALEIARRVDDPDACIVAILCDTGERYLSKVYNDEWLEAKGLLLGGSGKSDS